MYDRHRRNFHNPVSRPVLPGGLVHRPEPKIMHSQKTQFRFEREYFLSQQGRAEVALMALAELIGREAYEQWVDDNTVDGEAWSSILEKAKAAIKAETDKKYDRHWSDDPKYREDIDVIHGC